MVWFIINFIILNKYNYYNRENGKKSGEGTLVYPKGKEEIQSSEYIG